MADKNLTSDIHDSEKDKAKLEPEETTIDLPDVKDIPGQENVHVPELREMADTTISSDDEEGVGLFGEDEAEYASERLPVGEEIDENDLIISSDEEPETTDEPDGDPDEEDDPGITEEPSSDDADVTEDEKIALERTEQTDTEDNENLFESELDDTDEDGEDLNEGEDFSGDDLDIPGEDLDDAEEDIGEEDEENNAYSLGDNE
ncbi:hypothetical protein [Parafilimonas terrae]|uniref:Uncharacterized protein n=1 Tax=Parafilimonas terrae TaxID=1465490 RepID=A0A1I5XPY0_9BACT|nr:hypothetical protein [Parafilimonas terrae]SFQ33970.1 hypothetical protein SAMN05444277_10997 [Parafilimonas terrae]